MSLRGECGHEAAAKARVDAAAHRPRKVRHPVGGGLLESQENAESTIVIFISYFVLLIVT